ADMVLPPLKVPPARKARLAPSVAPQEAVTDAGPAVDCAPVLTLAAQPGAIAQITFAATCDPGAAIAVHHAGLSITGRLSDKGTFAADLPSLQRTATVAIELKGNIVATRTLSLPDFDRFARVALQWQGDSGLEIHALELGADYGMPGHVWAKAPGAVDDVLREDAGFLTRLGAGTGPTDTHAEIYSFPTLPQRQPGTVRLSVEAAVTRTTCGRKVSGRSFQNTGMGGVQQTELTLEMPDCDTVGDILVLKNLLRDIKIASK
ncbi:hypothetical protein LCGC14_2416110, partial [marine sediment metagenome]